MHLRSFLRRGRPSPALVISSIALFVSLGGVGYAAIQLPDGSVGSRQIRKEAVTYTKIRPGAVGNVRANTRQLQQRVWKSCPADNALVSIARNGDPTCKPTLPAEFGTTNNTADSVGSTAATVTSVALPTGASYLAFANPSVTVTPDAKSAATDTQHVTVTCILTVGSNTETRSVTVNTTGTQAETASFPMQASGQSGTGSLSCTSAVAKFTGTGTAPAAPTVSVTSAINAVQTQ